jgi:ubiquinone/menaquinone biosynthesis C-methylase UbiE
MPIPPGEPRLRRGCLRVSSPRPRSGAPPKQSGKTKALHRKAEGSSVADCFGASPSLRPWAYAGRDPGAPLESTRKPRFMAIWEPTTRRPSSDQGPISCPDNGVHLTCCRTASQADHEFAPLCRVRTVQGGRPSDVPYRETVRAMMHDLGASAREAITGPYDDGYRRCPCFWGTEPGSFVKLLRQYEPSFAGRRVLDAGCGEGKNAVFMASMDAEVDAIDMSETAVENGRRRWSDVPGVHWRVADVCNAEFPSDQYHVVICYGLLHCLRDASQVLATVSRLQQLTVLGGYHVVCAFNNRRQELRDAHPGFHPCLLGHDQYRRMYTSWQVLASSDEDVTEQHPHNMIEHTHSLTRLLARRIA